MRVLLWLSTSSALVSLACSGGGFRDFPLRGMGGGTVRLSLEGDLSGSAESPGVTQNALDAEISFPSPLRQCPSSAVLWQHTYQGSDWNLDACVAGDGLKWTGTEGSGASIEQIEIDFDHQLGSLYLSAKLSTAPWQVSAHVAVPLPANVSGDVSGTAVWTTYIDNDNVEVGRSTVTFRWAFDPAITREWVGKGRG